MDSETRRAIYLRGLTVKTIDGYARFTPKQRKRHQKKWNKETNPKNLDK